jgi:hypothetical protein
VKSANILLLYTDQYYLIKQVYPFGLDLIANYLRDYGHRVTLAYPFLPDPEVETNLRNILEETRPDIIGLGIRNLDTCLSCEPYGDYVGNDFRTFYFLPDIRRIVELVRTHSPDVPIIAGGGGFTISPQAILNYLGIEYGVTGEGEEPLKKFVEAFPDREKIRSISGLVYRDGSQVRINPRKVYSFREVAFSSGRERRFQFAFETAGLPVQVKRGCNQACSYCVEPIIETGNILFRDIDHVIAELKALAEGHDGIRQLFFVDTEFNLPDLAYCTRLVERIVEEGLHERFGFTSQFLPKPFDSGFAGLLAQAGFSIILTCDSFSDKVLRQNYTSYRLKDIQSTLEICEKAGLPCTLSMIFGLPGETYETIDHSIDQMRIYRPGVLRRYEYTLGGRIYQGTRLCRMIEKGEGTEHLYGSPSEGYVSPCYFCAPDSPFRLKAYIENALGYAIAYENRYDPGAQQSLAMAFMVDQEQWNKVAPTLMDSNISARLRIYDYLFRKMTGAGRVDDARKLSENLLAAIQEDASGQYCNEISVIRFYLSLIK